jgi:PadR family transcriptional regulator PadR
MNPGSSNPFARLLKRDWARSPGLAFEHLRSSLTKGNLWLYVLAELRSGSATPGELKANVQRKHGFAPAAITFYSVIYKHRREGLVLRSSDNFRSAYSITPRGEKALAEALELIEEVGRGLRSA